MKIKRLFEIPYQPEYQRPEDFEVRESPPTLEEVSYLEKLAKEGKYPELEDYVNNQMIGRELLTRSPGIPTRDFLASALDQLVQKRYPGLNKLDEKSRIRFLKRNIHPGLDELEQAFGKSGRIAVGNGRDAYNHATGDISLSKEGAASTDTVAHEIGHSLDEIFNTYNSKKLIGKYVEAEEGPTEQEEAAIRKFLKTNPKAEKLLSDWGRKITTPSETSPLKSPKYKGISTYGEARTPSFEDYNWKKGQFESDVIKGPVDKYKEVGGEHHIDRPFSLENFINFSKGDLKDIVKNEQAPSKFQKIKKLIG